MEMNFELRIEQTQKLIMTPELQQAITLLQFSSLELMDYIQEEINNNPLLEVEKEEEGDGETGSMETRDNGESSSEEDRSFEWEEYFSDYESEYYSYQVSRNRDEQPTFEHFTSREHTLQEHLAFQLQLSSADQATFQAAEYLIGNLDSCGYLQGTAAEHARFLGMKVEEVEEALRLVQSFEPAGVGARGLRECLLLQLRERENVPPLVERIVDRHLEDMASGSCREAAHKLGVTQKEIQGAMDYIRTLNPKPGANLSSGEEIRYVVPDVIVENVEGSYVILVNDNVPHLMINPYYRNLLQRGGEEGVNSYIKKRLESALWLIKSIEQRRMTLYRVAEQIVFIQEPFMEKGIQHLRPLTLKDVAERIGMHESTVSRATANKYVQTPRGLFPFKFFFSGGIPGGRGEVHSVASIKACLKELVEGEDTSSPYSDKRLAERLAEKGMEVSRRTITKYREEMGIPASFKRRRF